MTGPILITGASGFLGRYILKDLRNHGLFVLGTSHKQHSPDWIQCDFGRLDMNELPHKISAIVHAAAYVPEKEALADPLESDVVNARATLALLRRYPSVPWVLISSGSIEADSENYFEKLDGLALDNFYDTGKFGAELYTSAYASTYGFPLTILRCSYLYGKGMRRTTVIMKFIENALQGKTLILSERGDRVFDFLHAMDVAVAVRLALLKEHTGKYFLGSGIATSIRELAVTIQRIVDLNLEIISYGEPPVVQLARPHSLDELKEQLGWEPRVDLVSGLAELIQEESQKGISCAS